MSRPQRWVMVSLVGVAIFAGTWWFAESVLGTDRGTAQALAGLAVALVTVPAGWWFALDPAAAPKTTVARPRSWLCTATAASSSRTRCRR